MSSFLPLKVFLLNDLDPTFVDLHHPTTWVKVVGVEKRLLNTSHRKKNPLAKISEIHLIVAHTLRDLAMKLEAELASELPCEVRMHAVLDQAGVVLQEERPQLDGDKARVWGLTGGCMFSFQHNLSNVMDGKHVFLKA